MKNFILKIKNLIKMFITELQEAGKNAGLAMRQ